MVVPVVVCAVVGAPFAYAAVSAARRPPDGPLPPVSDGALSRPVRGPGFGPQAAYRTWAVSVSERTGVPARALQSYAVADADVAASDPGCGLTWPTLAGVGSVESDHGRFRGRVLRADGHSSRPIFGPKLDGSPGVKAIHDTDDGLVDRDPRWDRAVGPLQFIPTTWEWAGVDGDGDGLADPQDMDDAAVSAARYLCRAGGDLTTTRGWSAAILAYNDSRTYVHTVERRATRYATASRSRPAAAAR